MKKSVLLHPEGWLHDRQDPHKRAGSLSDIILGGQDGLVNVLGIVLGVTVATSDPAIVLTAGMAAALAESVSMGAVAFTSSLADAEQYESERKRECRHIVRYPKFEEAEVRQLFEEKGLEGAGLDAIVEAVTSHPEVWVSILMSEKHGLVHMDRTQARRAAWIVGLSALIGSLVPLAPFLFFSTWVSMLVAVLLSVLILFTAGVIKARLTDGRPGPSGLEMAGIGTVSALVGMLVGFLFKAGPLA